jgi:hypothetical protein
MKKRGLNSERRLVKVLLHYFNYHNSSIMPVVMRGRWLVKENNFNLLVFETRAKNDRKVKVLAFTFLKN